jgi:class 3 adenylate cyclase
LNPITPQNGRQKSVIETGVSWLQQHHVVVRRELARFRGREVNTAGDGFLIAFDGPGRAIRCAMNISRQLRSLGIEIRAGLHSGECETVGTNLGGIAVHIGSRVAGTANAGEILVSSTVKDLVVGSGISFEDRGFGAQCAGKTASWISPFSIGWQLLAGSLMLTSTNSVRFIAMSE